MLWRKLSNVLLIVRHFRYNLRIAEARDFSDSDSHTSSESMEQNFEENDAPLDDNAPANRHIDRESAKHDEISYAGSIVVPSYIQTCFLERHLLRMKIPPQTGTPPHDYFSLTR